MDDLAVLQKTLGVSFIDISLLEQALVHSSYINEKSSLALVSNERLEFLGDAILGLVIGENLYQDFPYITPGELTKFRAVLICQDTLSHIAENIKLGDYLYLGKGEEISGGRHKPTNLAGALEALIAAVFLSHGLSVTHDCISRLFEEELQKVTSYGSSIDYKSRLQEVVQARGQQTPVYRVITEVGPDHDKVFHVEVMVGENIWGKGSGKSKKFAETNAARLALEQEVFTQ
ncbi:ribonuclease III [Chloroflexota bacterium]